MTKLDKRVYYDKRYSAQHLTVPSYFGAQFSYIMKMCGIHGPSARILDLGGGTGEYSLALQSLGYNVTLFDFSEIAVERARKIGVQEAICADFYTYNFQGSYYDIILAKGFSPLNTNDRDNFNHIIATITSVLAQKGTFVYWVNSNLSGTWSDGGWYHATAAELRQYFDHVTVFPAFRYGAHVPRGLNELISQVIMRSRRLPRPMTVIALKSKLISNP